MSRGTPQRAIRIEDELWEAAQAKAAEQGDNLSAIIRDELRAYINESETLTEAPESAELAEVIAAEFATEGETSGEIISRFQNAEAAARRILGNFDK